MKDIKDYLPYYIGQYVVHPALKNSRILTGRWMDSMIQKGIQIKPILRRLSDMTEEDLKSLIIKLSRFDLSDCEFEFDLYWVNAVKGGRVIDSLSIEQNGVIEMMSCDSSTLPQAEAFHYLLKQGFDLFGLIDEGAAIDAKTTTP